MKVIVVFEFPEVKDPRCEDADDIVQQLHINLTDLGYDYYIKNNTGELDN
jgi:hypothetical protein